MFYAENDFEAIFIYHKNKLLRRWIKVIGRKRLAVVRSLTVYYYEIERASWADAVGGNFGKGAKKLKLPGFFKGQIGPRVLKVVRDTGPESYKVQQWVREDDGWYRRVRFRKAKNWESW